jgi:hypothetical protein
MQHFKNLGTLRCADLLPCKGYLTTTSCAFSKFTEQGASFLRSVFARKDLARLTGGGGGGVVRLMTILAADSIYKHSKQSRCSL